VASTKVRLDRTAIAGMFLPGGQVYAEADRIRYWSQSYAKSYAPKRSGALARSIRSDMRGSNLNQTRFSVYSNLPYARYVSEGTGPIDIGKPMVLYQGPRFVPARYARTAGWLVPHVLGQDANDFLGKGLRRAMRKYGYL
jgi:hypothetical protein